MKFLTYGTGIGLFLFVVGGGAWLFNQDKIGHQAASSEPEYLILGQDAEPVPTPPAKLNRAAIRTVNPLRNDEVVAPPNPIRAASDIQPVATNETGFPRNESEKRFAGFDSLPAPPNASADSFLESAGFPSPPAENPVPAAPAEPKPLPQAPLNHQPTPLPGQAGHSLGNADPFAAGTSSIATPPMPAAAPMPEPQPLQAAPSASFATSQPPNHNPVPAPTRSSAPNAVRPTSEGTGSPGPAALEGAQTPHLTLEKVLPAEIVVDQPTTIKLVLRNVGRSAARDVAVRDYVPQGTRLLSTSPEATVSNEGELFWPLGSLDGGEQIAIEMRIVPVREGEIGSVATVNYSAEASARILVTRPKIHVDVKMPQEVRLGQVANLEITISNPGSATATGIVLEEYVPDGLYHKDGKVLVNKNVDSLKPKEAKKLTLPLTCTGSGTLVNRLIVKADGNLSVEEKTTIRALAPILNLQIAGPKQRFLERESDYRLVISNPGTASAQNVDLVMKLPTAVKFVRTNQSGIYEPSTHTVHWALEELPPQEAGEIELVLLPTKIGNHMLNFTGNGQNNLKGEASHPIAIDGLSSIAFEVVGQSPVELGKEAAYEIRVVNKGTKSATNVRVRMNLPDGMTFSKAEGPVRYQSQGGVVQFDALSQLDSKGEKVYRIAARCMADGDHRISVQVVSDELRTPITKEESTRVFQ